MQTERILELEFDYIRETAAQAIDDRYKTLNFYIAITTAVGSVMVGLLSLNSGAISATLFLGLSLLSLFTAAIGWVFVLLMVRLRRAWHESVVALNQIKHYYISQAPELAAALPWNTDSVPRLYRIGTAHFYASGLIMLLSSAFTALTVGFLLGIVHAPAAIIAAMVVLVGTANGISQLWTYRHLLR